MKLQPLISLISGAVLCCSASFAQVQIPSQPPAKPQTVQKENEQEPEEVFRINTQLVQIDAVVTDKNGAHVNDLKEGDFEIFVDGKKQSLTYFRLVKLPEIITPVATDNKKTTAPIGTPGSTPNIRQIAPEQVHRTIAFVVDDLGMSFESTAYARDALRKFVAKQMQDGDLVGIIRTGKGLGALQQFTSDRRLLNTAIDKLTWNPLSRDMMPKFGAQPGAPQQGANESDDSFAARQGAYERFEDFRETVFSVGTLGAVNFVVRGLRELPGRKMVILLSDGIRLFGRDRNNTQVRDNLRRLTDLANRSSVVIYTIDTRGLLTLAPSAADDLSRTSQQQMVEQRNQASQDLFDSQDGLVQLARDTGGFATLNNNDINLGVQKVIQDNQSYYLIGFDPDDEQFNVKFRDKFHAVKIKVNRPGLQVRTRSGYFGIPETLAREVPKTRAQQILHALYSPFGARDISVQMTSFFFNTQQGKSFVRSLLHIPPDKLTFADLPGGDKELKLDFATFTFDENGKTIESHGREFTMKLDKTQYEMTIKYGLTYQNDTPILKPGAYQFRMVLRDAASEKLGSAGQFITVPDLTKNHLALSGLTLTGKGPAAQNAASQEAQPSAAVRRFARTVSMEYVLIVYNAQPDKQTQQPKITIQSEIFQNGKPIFQGQPRPVDLANQSDLKRIVTGGELQLAGIPPGDYLLHVIINDPLAKAKYAQAEQWMDFSVR